MAKKWPPLGTYDNRELDMLYGRTLVVVVLLCVMSGSPRVCGFSTLPEVEPGADVLAWINSNAAVVVLCSHPDKIIDYVKSIRFDEDEQFISAIKLLTDSKFPLIHESRMAALSQIVSENANVLSKLDEVVFVGHDLSFDKSNWTIMIKTDEETLGQLEDKWKKLTDLLRNAQQPLESNSDNGDSQDEPDNSDFQAVKLDKWLLISNSMESVQEISNRSKGGILNSQSFAESRRFKILSSQFSKSNLASNTTIQILGNPVKLRALFPNITDSDWNAMRINELPSFGVQVFLVDSSDKNKQTVSPNVVFEACLNFTYPRTGFGKLLACYKPIGEMPAIGIRPMYMKAIGFDPYERYLAQSEMYEKQNPNERYMEMIEGRYADDPRDYMKDVVPRVDATFSITFIPAESSDIPKASSKVRKQYFPLIIERVKDPEASRRYAIGLIKKTNSFKHDRSERVLPIDNNYGELFAINADSAYPGYQKNGGLEQSYYFDDDWYMTGAIFGIKQQLSALHLGLVDGEDRFPFEPYSEMMSDLRRRFRLANEPFRIDLYDQKFWLEVADLVQQIRIGEKNERGQMGASSTNDDTPYEENSSLVIESTEDTKVMVEMHVKKALANAFGQQVIFYSQTENQLQIVGGLYPAINQKQQSPKADDR